MPIKFFTVSVYQGDKASLALERFISENHIETMDRQFINDGCNSAWCFCIYYTTVENSHTQAPTVSVKRSKIDYKEVLNEADFALYAQLRDLRKQLAEQEGVPVYTIFNNEQLAAMVQQQVNCNAHLLAITGIGEGRVKKYASAFLKILIEARSGR